MNETGQARPLEDGADALLAAACLALDPAAFGGIELRTDRDATCERWLALLRDWLPAGCPWRALPVHIDEERLLGGIDLAPTLSTGRAIYMKGLLAEAAGGLVVLGTAERLPARAAALVGMALDRRGPEGFALVALDGSRSEEEQLPPMLSARLGLWVELRQIRPEALDDARFDAAVIEHARRCFPQVATPPAALQALCATAMACGIESMRVPLWALRVARASAALAGRSLLAAEDLQAAARLVIAARARIAPAAEEQAPQPEEPPADSGAEDTGPAESNPEPSEQETAQPSAETPIADQVLAAARAAIPAQLLASLAANTASRGAAQAPGRSGAMLSHGRRGRPAGVRAGKPRRGTRLNLVATLSTAAPWQRLRRAEPGRQGARIIVRTDDLRVTHMRQRSETATIFVIDASGSSALHRLAEIKGAVEVLLAECYVRRDQVAVISFRGKSAEVLLPPTRSLLRAKRNLAGAPGGGATPLASGIDSARVLAEQLRRRGLTPALVLMTDGQANVARDGAFGRERAQLEAQQAAKVLGACQFRALLIDTSPRPQAAARALAEAMRCRYLPLPYADARALVGAVQSAS